MAHHALLLSLGSVLAVVATSGVLAAAVTVKTGVFEKVSADGKTITVKFAHAEASTELSVAANVNVRYDGKATELTAIKPGMSVTVQIDGKEAQLIIARAGPGRRASGGQAVEAEDDVKVDEQNRRRPQGQGDAQIEQGLQQQAGPGSAGRHARGDDSVGLHGQQSGRTKRTDPARSTRCPRQRLPWPDREPAATGTGPARSTRCPRQRLRSPAEDSSARGFRRQPSPVCRLQSHAVRVPITFTPLPTSRSCS